MTLPLAGLAKVVCALQVAQATVAGTVRDAETGEKISRARTIQVAVDAVSGEMCYATPDVFRRRVEGLSV